MVDKACRVRGTLPARTGKLGLTAALSKSSVENVKLRSPEKNKETRTDTHN
jgi:hypothetical protein